MSGTVPVMADMGQRVTDGINADPAEVERLRAAREAARQGRRAPRPEASRWPGDGSPPVREPM